MGFRNCTYNFKEIAETLGIELEYLKKVFSENQVGGYANIWSIEDKGDYSIANVSTSKKNKDGTYDKYDKFNGKFVRLVGKAHDLGKTLNTPTKGSIFIQIISGDTTNNYDAEKGVLYTNHKISEFTVCDFANSKNKSTNDNSKKSAKTKKAPEPVEDDDNELPF